MISRPPAGPIRARARPTVSLAAAALLLGACADDEFTPPEFETPITAIDYEAEIVGAPSEEIEELMRESLGLFRRQDEGAQSAAFLRRRGRDDVDVALEILRSRGYYSAEVEIEVTSAGEAPALDADAPPDEDSDDAPAAVATVLIEPGPPFILVGHEFEVIAPGDVPAPPLDAADFGSPIGEPAAARPILDAETAALAVLRRSGRPYAEQRDRDSVADFEQAEIEVVTTMFAGPYYVLGAPRFEGLENVDEEYLLTYVTWEPGQTYDPRLLAEYQQDLIDTGLFDAGFVRVPPEPPEGGVAPVIVRLDERDRRTISAGARYSSDSGPAVRAAFEHRNLFGANETLRLEALAALEEQRAEARYIVPQWMRPGQDFLAGFGVRRIEDDAFDELAATLTAGVERELSDRWTVGAGGLLELSETTDDGVETRYYLAGLPFFAQYDSTDDLLDPTQGARARIDLTPFAGVADQGDDPLFTRIDGSASTYLALDDATKYILAGRARLGSILAGDVDDVPAGRRLYSGGGGSVRGYEERFIGPLDDDDDPTGGLSVAELGVELRALVFDPIGVAAFVEAGSVDEESVPTFDEGVQYAAGLGARYASPVGPIRFDVAVPLNPRDEDDAFQFYISIGQAF